MRSSMSSGMRVTLEPFASASQAPEPIFLTANGNLASPSPSPPAYTPTPTNLTRDASFGSGSNNKMDTTDNSTPLENTRSGSNAPGHPKPSKEEKADSAASKEKDSKYLEQFLQSMSHLPEFVTEKMSKIKGIDKAITQKSQAIKEASAYHVQMIHAKLTPPKKDDSAAGGATPSSSPISSTSSPMDLSPSGSSSSFAASSPSSSSSSSLPPLPNPSPLTPPLPYTLTPSVIQPLATENLFNSLTYLLVGPVVHQSSMLSNGATTIAQQQSAGNNSISVSKQDMGIMPMHISPASYPPVGKKLSSTAAQAFAHPFASIPSPMELQSTAVTPTTVDPPATLANDLLDFRKRFPTPAEYDLDQAEKIMKEHHAQIIDWQKSKSVFVNDLFEQLDQLAKRADISVKKYDLKLRRGNFEVPATPIDRRRVTGAATATGVDSRKRSYSTMVHELESRELQYALQNELRLEIEKQSANALTTHSTAGVNASAGASGSTSPQAEPNEPVYCICKKVSFGAMVACDNEDCEIEWFHFACVQLDTKPKGKWLCPDCRKKKKKAAAEAGGEKEKESSTTSSEKEKEKDKKDSSDKSEKESSTASSKEKEKEKDKEKDKDKEKHDDDKPEKSEKPNKKDKHDKHEKHEKHEKGEKHEKHEKKEKHDKSDKEKEKHKEKSEHHEKKQKKEK